MSCEKLSLLGLSDSKIKETLKNEALSKILCEIVDMVGNSSCIDKSRGNFLYTLGTTLPKQFHCHLPLLVKYVIEGKLDQDAKVTAAIKFIQNNVCKEFPLEKFEKECGVGLEISQEQIEATVSKLITENNDKLSEQRYHFNTGPLMGKCKTILKWADNRKIKEEIDLQILTLLGPKRDDDLVKPSKKKANIETPKKQTSKAQVNDSTTSAEPEKQPLTIQEFLKSVQFHKPGENFKTDGYTINSNTHKLLQEHIKLTRGQVRTRFPPEPNGILHIGHAKAININFGYAAAHDGICFLRFDDTNPEKEEEKFFTGIKDMVQWLGYKPFKVTHSSDYFDLLYQWAKKLICDDLAYVCHQRPEEVRGRDPPPSPWRDRPIEESLKLFEHMKMGFFNEGEATLRLKHKLEEGKMDPIAYRIKYCAHHRTKDTWCIYPTYDYTHCLCDSIEHITHSLCTKEFQSRRSSYYWLCNAVEVYCPVQWEYGRLNMNYAVVSKRKIKKLIDAEIVRDWDDPRLFTLTALRRRGFPPEAVNNFCATLGLTGAQIAIHPDALDASVRDVLNVSAHRSMVVIEPLKVNICNFPSESSICVQVPNIPGNEQAGEHSVPFDKEVWIELSDFKEIDEKGYRRLTPNQSVGLRHTGYIIRLKEVLYDANDKINGLNATCEPVSAGNKPKAFIHWVSHPITCEVRLYKRLFLHENPEDATTVPGGFLTDINPDSLEVITGAMADQSLKCAKIFEKYQFERLGFFSVDPDSTPSRPVFNRTVTLKEDKGKASS